MLRFLFINLPVFFAMAGIGLFLVTKISALFAENGTEPKLGLVGFLLTLMVFVIPAVYATLRFEDVAIYEEDG